MSLERDDGSVAEVGPDVTVEPESVPRQVLDQVRRRWKTVGAIAVTAATTAAVHRIDAGWSTDAVAFALITAALFGYTAVTLYNDLELE